MNYRLESVMFQHKLCYTLRYSPSAAEWLLQRWRTKLLTMRNLTSPHNTQSFTSGHVSSHTSSDNITVRWCHTQVPKQIPSWALAHQNENDPDEYSRFTQWRRPNRSAQIDALKSPKENWRERKMSFIWSEKAVTARTPPTPEPTPPPPSVTLSHSLSQSVSLSFSFFMWRRSETLKSSDTSSPPFNHFSSSSSSCSNIWPLSRSHDRPTDLSRLRLSKWEMIHSWKIIGFWKTWIVRRTTTRYFEIL